MDPRTLIHDYFAQIGLSPEVSQIYLALMTAGPFTISELSRHAGIERTRIYRLLDELTANQLIISDPTAKKGLYRAAPLSNLHHLLDSKTQTIKQLKDNLTLIEYSLGDRRINTPTDDVTSFSQADGLRHIWWSLLDSSTPIMGYQDSAVFGALSQTFLDEWAQQFQHRQLQAKIFVNSIEHTQELSAIRGLKYYTIDSSKLDISHSCLVWDDNVATISWHQGQAFGIVHRNRQYALAQRQWLAQL